MALSDAYEHLRKLREGRAIADATWEPPTRFTRDTTKFWLRPCDVMAFKCELVKHLPLLIFGKRPKLIDGLHPFPHDS